MNKKKIKDRYDKFKENNKNIEINSDDKEFFRTFVTKGERVISHILKLEFSKTDNIKAQDITKKVKQHINMKNKIINEILYIEEFFKAYFEFILDYDWKYLIINKMWKDIIDVCHQNRKELELTESQISNLEKIKQIRNQFSHNQIYDKSLEQLNEDYDKYIRPIKSFISNFYKD